MVASHFALPEQMPYENVAALFRPLAVQFVDGKPTLAKGTASGSGSRTRAAASSAPSAPTARVEDDRSDSEMTNVDQALMHDNLYRRYLQDLSHLKDMREPTPPADTGSTLDNPGLGGFLSGRTASDMVDDVARIYKNYGTRDLEDTCSYGNDGVDLQGMGAQ